MGDATEPDGVVHVTEGEKVSTPSKPGLTLQLASRKHLTETIDRLKFVCFPNSGGAKRPPEPSRGAIATRRKRAYAGSCRQARRPRTVGEEWAVGAWMQPERRPRMAGVEAERSEPIARARGNRDLAGKRPNEAIDLALCMKSPTRL